MTSLSFDSGSVTLATWGFSAGDIALIAGAGRKAGTWLMARFKDRALLDLMNVDIDTVFKRKGLFETADLHKRWDQKFTLYKNGQRTSFSTAELNGVIHFLYWLIHDDSKLYSTASTDIFSLAIVLQELGMKIKPLETRDSSDIDESEVIVAWSDNIAPTALIKKQRVFRPGMRIPLSHMEEVASLFPGNVDRNRMRSYFELGMGAVKKDGLRLRPCSDDSPPRVKGSPFLER
ncbi:MAG: hypothetical protein Q9184_005222 [Pyrenodesmia sp. 2 TL-2023]